MANVTAIVEGKTPARERVALSFYIQYYGVVVVDGGNVNGHVSRMILRFKVSGVHSCWPAAAGSRTGGCLDGSALFLQYGGLRCHVTVELAPG